MIVTMHFCKVIAGQVFKPGMLACDWCAPGFLKLILCGLSVCVFVSAPKAINN